MQYLKSTCPHLTHLKEEYMGAVQKPLCFTDFGY